MTETTPKVQEIPGDLDDNYVMVLEDAVLHELCDQWRQADFLAMDTEFIRTTTFFPHVGLIQINAGGGNYLIDPLAISEWAPFCDLMTNPDIIKIFHSCSEDLQVFMAAMQLVPTPVFDTQIASALLNKGFGNSYQATVMQYMNIDLPKGETRSDWLQRPLKTKQCHYAALDVAYLLPIYQAQQNALTAKNRMHWLQEECANQINQYQVELEADFSLYFRNIKGAWQLNQEQLAALRLLAEWRELRARKRDRPRNWIIKDKQLIDIARQCPGQIDELQNIDDLGKNFLHHEGADIIKLVARAKALPESALPEPLHQPLDGKAKNQLKRGQQFAEQKAAELDLPVEMLIRKRWLISLLQKLQSCNGASVEIEENTFLPIEMQGWRKSLLMPELLEVMK